MIFCYKASLVTGIVQLWEPAIRNTCNRAKLSREHFLNLRLADTAFRLIGAVHLVKRLVLGPVERNIMTTMMLPPLDRYGRA